MEPAPSDENPPPLPGHFFPPIQERHHGMRRELTHPQTMPSIVEPADYLCEMENGYEAVLRYLLPLPLRAGSMDVFRIADLHRCLYEKLYRDAGKLRGPEDHPMFGGRWGKDYLEVPALLVQLARTPLTHAVGWTAPPTSEADYSERLVFVANYHASLVMLHPFRDGNGRLARAITWWQEICLFLTPLQTMPRVAYFTGLEALPGDMRLLFNFFLMRHGLPVSCLDPLPPLFPVW